MQAEARRQAVLDILQRSAQPVSAGTLATRFSVSRQIIVGDIALLRASGADISATPRGYVMQSSPTGMIRRIACQHETNDKMEAELNTIVDNGCTVLDVVVEHPIYGQITGPLELANRYDVQQFIARCAEESAQPLSMLTEGIHLHTLSCPSEEAYDRVCRQLRELGVLLN